MTDDKTVQLAVNTIRTLSIDAVQTAKSGHPGTPMALAPLVYTIWNITIEGDTRITFTEDVAARFLAYGWNVLRVGDANDIARREGAPGDRAGLDLRLGAVRRRRGARHRDEDVRGVRPAQGAAEEVRVRARPGRGHGEGTAGQEVEAP
jgi:hypothetical protein